MARDPLFYETRELGNLEDQTMFAQKVLETVETCFALGFGVGLYALPFVLVLTSPLWIGS